MKQFFTFRLHMFYNEHGYRQYACPLLSISWYADWWADWKGVQNRVDSMSPYGYFVDPFNIAANVKKEVAEIVWAFDLETTKSYCRMFFDGDMGFEYKLEFEKITDQLMVCRFFSRKTEKRTIICPIPDDFDFQTYSFDADLGIENVKRKTEYTYRELLDM
jgi:hypothetical protein